jgi:hypothetical protein
MHALDCLQTVHSSPGRLRYRLRAAKPIPWPELQRELNQRLTGLPLYWRLTPGACSVLLVYRPPLDDLSDGPDVAAAILRQASQRLIAALGSCGVTPAPPELIEIRTHQHSNRLAAWRALGSGLINGLSAGVSLLLVALASLLILLGSLGLMLPWGPGSLLLLLAYGLVELALWVRQPFVNA